MDDPGECPECKKLGLSSKIYIGIGFTTSCGVEKYFENGRYHHHNRNETKSTWSCSNKHSGTMYSMKSCPVPSCNFIGFTEMIVDPVKPAPVEHDKLEKGVPLSEQRVHVPFNTNIEPLVRSATVYHNILEDNRGIVKISSPDVSIDLHLTEGQLFEVSMVSGKIIVRPMSTATRVGE